MGWDTINCTFWMLATKANKMAAVAEAMIETGVASLQELSKLQGKLVFKLFTLCLHAVLLLTRALNTFIGSPTTDLDSA